jgi:toxin ParE1/3/4
VKRPVRVLRRAQLDFLEIQAYVLRDDPTAATRLIDRLVAELERLGAFPSRRARPRDERLRRVGYRYVVHGQYLIFYKVLRSYVRVFCVLHGRRSYRDIL